MRPEQNRRAVMCKCGETRYVDEWFGDVGIRHYVCGHKEKITR
jgi:hypothetical protein